MQNARLDELPAGIKIARRNINNLKYAEATTLLGFPSGSVVKNLLAKQETWAPSLGWEDALEKEIATPSSTLAWEIPWREEPGGL